MILWRELFTHVGIQWVDRGANTSRGHINVKCAWCKDEDPSYHLAIEETTGAYYCRRNPDHYGRSAWRLLSALGLWKKAEKLLDDYSTTPVPRPAGQIREEEKPRRRLGLRPAHEVPPALEYLRTRGYADPEKTARTFGLAAAPYGRLAARVFFPIDADAEEYIGRAVHSHMEPRYLSTAEKSSLYVPLPEQYEGGFLFLVEGPFDALRLQSTILEIFGRRFGGTAALLGLGLTSDKLLHLVRLIDAADVTFQVLDRDQDVHRSEQRAYSLQLRTKKKVLRVECPSGRKDLGESTGEEVALWLRTLTSNGQEYSRTGAEASYLDRAGAFRT